MAEIKKIKPLAETEVLEEPRQTLGGRLSRQKKAKEDLKSLTETYRQQLLNSAVFVLVTGDGREAFIETATRDFGFFSANPDKFFSDIVNAVSPSLYENKESSPNVLDVVGRVLENKALEIGIVGYPMLTFRQEFRRLIKTKSDFQILIKEIISKQVGTEVVGAQAIKDILSAALKSEHQGKTTPILLSLENINEELISGLKRISAKVGVIYVDSTEVNGAEAMKALNMLKNTMALGGLASYTIEKQTELKAGETQEQAEVRVVNEILKDIPEYDIEAAAIASAMNMGAAETLIFPNETDYLEFADGFNKNALKGEIIDVSKAVLSEETIERSLAEVVNSLPISEPTLAKKRTRSSKKPE